MSSSTSFPLVKSKFRSPDLPHFPEYAPHLKLVQYATRCLTCDRIFLSDKALREHVTYVDDTEDDEDNADISADFRPPGLFVRPCPKSKRSLEVGRAMTAKSMAVLGSLGTKVTILTGPRGSAESARQAVGARQAMGEGRPQKRIRETFLTQRSTNSAPPSKKPEQRSSARTKKMPEKPSGSGNGSSVVRIGSDAYFPCATCSKTFYSENDRQKHNCPDRVKGREATEEEAELGGGLVGAPTMMLGIGEAVKMRRRSARK